MSLRCASTCEKLDVCCCSKARSIDYHLVVIYILVEKSHSKYEHEHQNRDQGIAAPESSRLVVNNSEQEKGDTTSSCIGTSNCVPHRLSQTNRLKVHGQHDDEIYASPSAIIGG